MILERIVSSTKVRVEQAKNTLSFDKLVEKVEAIQDDTKRSPKPHDYVFEKALNNRQVNFICEVKKASPSKGLISDDFDYIKIAQEYQATGAACISVLTEPDYFMGANKYLEEIKNNVSIPLLRKDFIIDSYQIYESYLIGADCILLICSILSDKQLEEYMEIAHRLGLSVLVESHDENEVGRALSHGARIIGVNNRNLKDFTVDIENSLRLRKLVPDNILFISESGIETAEDIRRCYEANVNGVLIGEALMKAKDKKKKLDELRKGIK